MLYAENEKLKARMKLSWKSKANCKEKKRIKKNDSKKESGDLMKNCWQFCVHPWDEGCFCRKINWRFHDFHVWIKAAQRAYYTYIYPATAEYLCVSRNPKVVSRTKRRKNWTKDPTTKWDEEKKFSFWGMCKREEKRTSKEFLWGFYVPDKAAFHFSRTSSTAFIFRCFEASKKRRVQTRSSRQFDEGVQEEDDIKTKLNLKTCGKMKIYAHSTVRKTQT